MSVTRFGVSLQKVVATIERPASHQGTERPDAKNSAVLLPDRLPKKRAGTKQIASVDGDDHPVERLDVHGGSSSSRGPGAVRRLAGVYFFGRSAAISSLAWARSIRASPANCWPEKRASPPSIVSSSPVWYGLASLSR